MPIATPPRSLKFGVIIEKTLAVIEHCALPVLAYVAALTVINGAITFFTRNMTGITDQLVLALVGVAVSIVASYLFVVVAVQRTGLRTRGEGDVFVPYCLMSLLFTLGFVAGLILLVIPGLVVLARWIMAAPMVIARGDGAKQALGESWERTSGAEFPILGALLVLLVPVIAISIACSMLFDPADPVGIGVSQLASSAGSAAIQAMGIAIYGMLIGTPAATFEAE